MAERRMFAKTIIDSDAFLEMPMSTQALYFHLAMRADDDGFLNNPKKVQRMIGAADDDLRVLISKRFLIPFESGVVVIKHWKIHNYIRNDRYKPTVYQEEKDQLTTKENGAYTLSRPAGIPSDNQPVYQMETQVRIGKARTGKDRIGQENSVYTRAREDGDDGFEDFWNAYPKKTGDIKQAYFEYVGALEHGATLGDMLSALEWQKQQPEWTGERARFIPSAEKWLRNRGWTAEKPRGAETGNIFLQMMEEGTT